MELARLIVPAIYVVTPAVAAGIVVYKCVRARSARPAGGFLVTCASSLLLGVAMTVLFAVAVGGELTASQVLITAWFAAAALTLLKGLSRLLEMWTMRLFRVSYHPAAAVGRLYRTRFVSSFLLRILLLYVVGLPYVMAVAMVYRPKALPTDDPYTQLGFRFEPVKFMSTDGVRLDGWWIPAQQQPRRKGRLGAEPEEWGKKTVVLCHGLGANKGNQLVMAQDLVPGGYNVLAFDFRAHGASGGQLSTFGDLERRDVLGAVRWVRENRPAQSEKIFGVGASMGAAALIAAAADPSADGQAIDAIAVYGTYDDLGSLVQGMADNYFVPPLDWMAVNMGLPLASAHAGRPLGSFSPAKEVQGLWPRPILVIHGRRDRIIDFDHGEKLYDAAKQPRYRYWVSDSDHNGVVSDPVVSKAVLLFFENARSIL